MREKITDTQGTGFLKKVSRLLLRFRKRADWYRSVALPLRSMDDFCDLPILSRQELLCFKSIRLQKVFNVTATSGSSGEKLFVVHSREAHQAHIARLSRLYRSVTTPEKDLCLNLCSYTLNSGGRLMESGYKAAGVGVVPFGQIRNHQDLQEVLGIIRELKPTVVNAYTNQLFELFSCLGRKHSIKKCIVNGEPLFEGYKKQIEKMGGVRIYDHYGAMEVSGFAIAQRPGDAYMKVFGDDLFLEVLKDDGTCVRQGKGVLLVTDMNNDSMPFVRYKLGDVVDLVKKDGARWIKVLGRADDSLLINGVVVIKNDILEKVSSAINSPDFFFVLNKDQVVYKDKVILNVRKNSVSAASRVVEKIVKEFEIGHCIQVNSYSGEIPKTSTGKRKHFIDGRSSNR